jgi:uroporphyrinogen-III synthase
VEALLEQLDPVLRLLHLAGEERVEAGAGRHVISVAAYRAEPLPLPPASLVEGRVLLIHSPAAGRRLSTLVCDRRQVRIVAISPAAAEACGVGWERIEAAHQPSDAALLSLACGLCEDGPS